MGTGLKVFLIGFALLSGMLIIWRIMKWGGGRAFLLSSLQGLAALSAVNLLGTVTGISVALNILSILTAVLCGLPGIAGLLIADLIFAK